MFRGIRNSDRFMTNRRPNRIKIAPIVASAIIVPIVLYSAASLGAAERVELPIEVLRSLVDDYAHAIETNNHPLAMSYVHPDSPFRPEIDAALRGQLSSYFERARITGLEATRRSDGTISAMVIQETVRVIGLKFTRHVRRTAYRVRQQDGSWWIWELREVATN